MRNFAAADRMTNMMERFGMEEGEALEHSLLNRSVETAQKRVEQHRYRQRKYVLDFDDVMNNQREVVYGYRNEALTSEDPRELIYEVIDKAIPEKVDFYINQRDEGASDLLELIGWANMSFPLRLDKDQVGFEKMDADQISEYLIEQVKKAYEIKVQHENPLALDNLERQIIMVAIDRQWQQHLYNMDSLRDGISLRAQGQKDPLVEYKNEAYKLFEELMGNIEEEALGNLFRSYTNLEAYEDFLQNLPMEMGGSPPSQGQVAQRNMSVTTDIPEEARPTKPEVKLTLPKRRPTVKVGRNDNCPCGSGKKFKSCCGKEE